MRAKILLFYILFIKLPERFRLFMASKRSEMSYTVYHQNEKGKFQKIEFAHLDKTISPLKNLTSDHVIYCVVFSILLV